MIFPVPTASTVGYIRMYIIQNLIDLTASTAESDILMAKSIRNITHLLLLVLNNMDTRDDKCLIKHKNQKQDFMESSFESM